MVQEKKVIASWRLVRGKWPTSWALKAIAAVWVMNPTSTRAVPATPTRLLL